MYYFPGISLKFNVQKSISFSFLVAKALSSHLFFTKLIKLENEHS